MVLLNRGRIRSQLSGIVCAYHPAAQGSSPKHAIYAFSFIVFVLYLSCEKNENKQKRGRVWPIFLKKNYYVYEIAKIIDTIHEG